MQNELIELQRRLKKTIVFITHDFQEAIKLGDHIAIMKDGVIVQVGGPAELVARPADDYVANFTSEIDRGRVFTAQSIMKAGDHSLREDSTCDAASRALNGSGQSYVFVLNGVGQPVGYVDERHIRGEDAGDRPISTAMATDFPRVSPDRHLADIYSYCDTDAPLAVVDVDDGRFLGYVSSRDILVNLACSRSEGDDSRKDATSLATSVQEEPHEQSLSWTTSCLSRTGSRSGSIGWSPNGDRCSKPFAGRWPTSSTRWRPSSSTYRFPFS